METFLVSFLRSKRSCFSREAAFNWFVSVFAGVMLRDDMLGVTSFVRAQGVNPKRYTSLLHFFRATSWSGTTLLAHTATWAHGQGLTLKRNGRVLMPVDDSNVPREGVRTPLVGTIRQTSETSSKPSHFRGHTWGAVSLLAGSPDKIFAVPVWADIYEPGVKSQENSQPRTHTLVSAGIGVAEMLNEKGYLIGDAWFNNKTGVTHVRNTHGKVELISRARVDAVGYECPAPEPARRGRKRKYGQKIKIRTLFDSPKTLFDERIVTIYGKKETVKLHAVNLIRKPGDLIRFVLAKTSRGRIVVTSTDLDIDPVDALELYGLRSPIEETFNAVKNIMGATTGRFWTKSLQRVSRRPTRNDKLQSNTDCPKVADTAKAHRNMVQLAFAALAFLQIFACLYGAEAVGMANFWMRTPSRTTPSPRIARKAVGILLRELLHGQPHDHARSIFKKSAAIPPSVRGAAKS